MFDMNKLYSDIQPGNPEILELSLAIKLTLIEASYANKEMHQKFKLIIKSQDDIIKRLLELNHSFTLKNTTTPTTKCSHKV